jgi:tetratricopeptide (TPR) repeat protein
LDFAESAVKEQEEKLARTRKSAPAFLRAARLMANERNFDDALAQVTTALDADPELTDAHLLKGQVLLVLGRFAEAEAPLRAYLKRKPEALAGKLADLAARPEPDKAEYLWLLVGVFEKQKAMPFVHQMTLLAERVAGPGNDLLALYRKRIEAAPGWAGLGKQVIRDKEGELHLSLAHLGKNVRVRDLSPLKGMKLSTLNLYHTAVEDLTPLQGMPLTRLDLGGCAGVKDLRPLRGMPLTWLNLDGLDKLTDLEPLRGLPLTYLKLSHCYALTDLGPLRGMPLTTLDCGTFRGMKIANLEPLTGMKLKVLNLGGASLLKDITPLRDMPLEWLSLYNVREVRDFEPLRGRPLTHLSMYVCAIRDLSVLKDMPLTWLSLDGCANVQDLTPLAGMKLTYLNLHGLTRVEDLHLLHDMPLQELFLGGCKNVRDFEVLKGLRLTRLEMPGCPQLTSLEFLRDMKQLGHLNIRECNQLRDLGPLKGLKLKTIAVTPRLIDPNNMDVLRGMNLDKIWVTANVGFAGPEFWKKYEAGEFK